MKTQNRILKETQGFAGWNGIAAPLLDESKEAQAIIRRLGRSQKWEISKQSPFTTFFTKEWSRPPPFLFLYSYGELCNLLNEDSKDINWALLFDNTIRLEIDGFQRDFLKAWGSATNYLELRHQTCEDSAAQLKALAEGEKPARDLNATEELEERAEFRDIEDKKWKFSQNEPEEEEGNEGSELIPRYPFLDETSAAEDTDGSLKSFVVDTPLPTFKKRKLNDEIGEKGSKRVRRRLKKGAEQPLDLVKGKNGKISGHKRRYSGFVERSAE